MKYPLLKPGLQPSPLPWRVAPIRSGQAWVLIDANGDNVALANCTENAKQNMEFIAAELNRMRQSGPVCPKCGDERLLLGRDVDDRLWVLCPCGNLVEAALGAIDYLRQFFPVAAPVDIERLADLIQDEWTNGVTVTVEDAALYVLRKALGADTKEGKSDL